MFNQEKRRVILFYATTIAMAIYIVWRVFFSLPLKYGVASLVFGILMIICETIAVIEALEQYRHMSKPCIPELPVIPNEKYPNVDVLIATHNESPELLYKTVNACTYMDYPDKSKVHIYICDDMNRPEMALLAETLGVGYFGLANNTQAKAGNLNNALSKTSSPLVATFDADMIPRKNFLLRTVPYFYLPSMKKDAAGEWVQRKDEEIDPAYKIGFIQTPQSFYNPDLFQYNLHAERRVPNEQDYFFREINVSRNSVNAPIYAGSNTVISREALEKAGGIATGTITEDFETGLNIQKNGYATYAVPEVLAHGLAPTDVKSLLNQRERWGRGCVQSLRRVKLLSSKNLKPSAKINYLLCLAYWWTFFRRFIYIASPILFTVFHLRVVNCTLWEILIFWLPSYLLYNQTLKVLSGNIRNQHWSNVIDTIIFPYMIIPVMLETIGIRKEKFVVTRKDRKSDDQTSAILYAVPHLILLAISILALGICFKLTIESAMAYNIVIMYWLAVNSKNLILAVFFMLGRKNYRQAERYFVELPIIIEYMGKQMSGVTTDISETGLAVLLDRPEYLPCDEQFDLRIKYEGYIADLSCIIVHVEQKANQWRYCIHIKQIDAANRREYYQIVYDRGHSLPSKLAATLSVFDDFSLNWDQQQHTIKYTIRRLPRIDLGIPVSFPTGETGIIHNFNYHYIMISSLTESYNSEACEIILEPGLALKLQEIDMERTMKDNGKLFEVKNWNELVANTRFEKILDLWIKNKAAKEKEQEAPVFLHATLCDLSLVRTAN